MNPLQPAEPITEPGIYTLDADDYHRDPVCMPSLSSSGIRTMLDRSPAHLYATHPRLGGDGSEDRGSAAMNMGSVIHALLLGTGKRWRVIDADSYRTKAAQAARDEAEALGLVPVLAEQFSRAQAAAAAMRCNLQRIDGCGAVLQTHMAERTMVWKEGSVWCRAMADLLPQERDADGWLTIYDLKTTEQALSGPALARKLVADGYDVQAAFYVRGLEALRPNDRVRFRFLFVETVAPYGAVCVEPSGHMVTTGEQKCLAGIGIWRQCMESGAWPGYPTTVQRLEPPAYLESQWCDREAADPLIAGALNNWSKAA